MMTFQEAEQYILDIPKFAAKNTLADTASILKKLNCENMESRIIHVAGTNGKGSVCAYLCSILRESKLSCGLFISPHLVDIRERISIDREMISKEDFVRCFETVKNAVTTERHPSFFEFLFLMAMVYFQEKKPDLIVLETGLGGRLDATNSVPKKDLCVITEIGFDHMQYLGNTLAEIAGEKAGILREDVPVVFSDKREETTKVLTERAKKLGISEYPVKKKDISEVTIGDKTIDFSLSTGYYKYIGLSLKKTALYQLENASLAVQAAEVLSKMDPRIKETSIREGIRSAYWPGRMEEIRKGIYLDGAHNEDGIEAFLDSVRIHPCAGRRLLLFGVVSDKQYELMIEKIAASHLFDAVYVTALETERSAALEKLKKIWHTYTSFCSFYEDAESAYHQICFDRKQNDDIYIAGSLYLIGQMKALIKETPDD